MPYDLDSPSSVAKDLFNTTLSSVALNTLGTVQEPKSVSNHCLQIRKSLVRA